jgi:glycosyltransferase involved in cell wall biosynthesis
MTTAGVRCSVLALDIGLTAARRKDFAGIDLHVLPCLNRRFYVPWARRDIIRRAVAGADVVEITGHWTLLNALVYTSARTLGKPYIVRPAGALGVVGRSATLKRLYNAIVGRRIVTDAAGYVAVTAGELPAFAAYGVAANRVAVIPNGVEIPSDVGRDCEPFVRHHALTGRRAILFVGRLSHIKGPDLLLEAFARVTGRMPEYDVVFAGPDDGLLHALRALAAERGIASRVRFPGYLAGHEKECAYQTCDFLALPSRREAMSLVALEAGARGKPVLLTDQCGFDDVESCGGGCVVTADVDGIARGLLEMAARRDQLPQMGRALQELVCARYTWRQAAEMFLSLCGTLVRCPNAAALH